MISIIITSFKEAETIGRAIEAFESNEFGEKFEVIVGAPDTETLEAASKLKKEYKNLIVFKDSGEGKPAALNALVKKAKGDILVLSDGDVYVSPDSVRHLIEKMHDENVGAVSGRPVSTNPRDNKFGFWAYLLTEIAHTRRTHALLTARKFFCSGYLFAIRKELFPELSKELLSEDGFISHSVYSSGKKIEYSGESLVYVKYPDNFSDWIKQKKRSAGGYNQIKQMIGVNIRSFGSESRGGFGLLKYASNLKEFFWLVQLAFARVYLWILIYRDINLSKKSHSEIWQRVDSTK